MAAQEERLIGGRYRILRKIAEGGMGEVFEAQHNLSKKAVALKILFPHIGKDEAARQRFLREVSAPAQIGHDAIVEVYDAGFDQEDGSLFVAMEFLDGEPFRDRLARGGSSIQQLLSWFEDILDPLGAAHASGIVHRDLKPENIFLQTKRDGSEVIKILDFGIARDLDQSETNVTHTGIAMGTPHYMAPEQAMSAKGVTAAADVWALGAMLYEALAGRPPFDGETASAIVVNACTRQHAPLAQVAPHVPPAISAFVDRCLDKEPRNRPQNASEMLQELRHIRSGGAASMPGGLPRTQAIGAQATGPFGGATPPPGYTPQGTAMLPQAGYGTPPPGYGTSPPGPGFGSSPSGYGTAPPGPGYGSTPGFGTASGPGFGAPGGYTTAAPEKGGGGLALGMIAAVLLGGVVVVGGGVAVAAIALSGDDDETTREVQTAQVRIDTDVPAGELLVDGASLGTLVPGQQFAIERGAHALQIREGGVVVAEATVQVNPGQDQAVSMNRVAPAHTGQMIPGTAQTLTGQLRRGDEQSPDGKYIDRHAMSWPAGSQVQVLLDSADFDTYLTVISPSGVQQTNDDRPGGGLNSGLTLTTGEAGQWTIAVSSFQPHVTGDYTLTIHGP